MLKRFAGAAALFFAVACNGSGAPHSAAHTAKAAVHAKPKPYVPVFVPENRHEKGLTPQQVDALRKAQSDPDHPAIPGMPVIHGQNWDSNDFDTDPLEQAGNGIRYKDPVVYVDGKPVAVMKYPELPRALKVAWRDDVELLDFKPGDTGPRSKPVRYRQYRVADYLASLGIDLKKIKMLHIHGSLARVAAVTGNQLRDQVRDSLRFDFARETEGKVRIYIPSDLKTNATFDKISGGFAVYINKEPPQVTEDDTLVLDGKPVVGIPYYGQPMRGGVRVYLDDRLATVIKRNQLGKPEKVGAAGDPIYRLVDVLAGQGVDTTKIAEAQLIYKGARAQLLDASELAKLTFAAGSKAKGQIILSDGDHANAIMLYTQKGEKVLAKNP
jgi:hypothetical protein